MYRTFEALLNEAADKRADVRIKPARDPRTGQITFYAHLHGIHGGASKHLIEGDRVSSLEMEVDRPRIEEQAP